MSVALPNLVRGAGSAAPVDGGAASGRPHANSVLLVLAVAVLNIVGS